jgi:signal transduction histidine kinase
MLLTGIRILALYVIIAADPTGITSVLVGFILFTLCFYMSPVLVLPLLIVYLYGYYLYLGLDFSTGQIQFGYLYEISSLILLYMLAVIIRWDDHVRRRNQFLVTQLEAYATNSISLGKQEERDRISRDLHDSLGHHLVSINIQLQKAVAYREIDAGESQNAVEQAQQATNQAIQELRQTIRDLREFEVEPHLEDEIQEIVDLVRQNGLSLEYSHSGTSAGFPELTLQALKQVVQEGLTNIQKHAQAKQAVLQIDYQRNWIRVLIQDDGVGFNPMKVNPADHYGLVGMRERLQIVGGKIRITSRPDTGTKLIIQLPKEIYG